MMFVGAAPLRITANDSSIAFEAEALERTAAPTRAKFVKLKEEKAAVPVRSNFSETAFFMPALRTDKNGVATLRFTLPESLTEWQFKRFCPRRATQLGHARRQNHCAQTAHGRSERAALPARRR